MPTKTKQNKTVGQTSDVHMLATTWASKHNEFNMLCYFKFGTLSAVTMTQYDLGGSPQPKQHGTGAGIHEELLWFLLPFGPQIPILIALPEANMAPQIRCLEDVGRLILSFWAAIFSGATATMFGLDHFRSGNDYNTHFQ